jgi:hypothetical protein
MMGVEYGTLDLGFDYSTTLSNHTDIFSLPQVYSSDL